MIKHILKVIWNERRINSWIVLELVLIFVILWFCNDYLRIMAEKRFDPVGFDIRHTYNVELDTLISDSRSKSTTLSRQNAFELILKRIKMNPDIENACVSVYAAPYAGSYMSMGYKVNSSAQQGVWTKGVTPEFFDVFKINLSVDWRHLTTEPGAVILGQEPDNLFKNIPIQKIDSVSSDGKRSKVLGFANPVKRGEFDNYEPIVYCLNKPSDMSNNMVVISIRVKPEADGAGFEDKFVNDMREQLSVGPYFLVTITPTSSVQKNYMTWTGASNGLKSVFSVISFLLINIFLGIIGTFWLRTQSRRGEIALQMALGASRRKVRLTYILEAVLLLFLASILGTILAVNLLAAEVFENVGFAMFNDNSQKVLSIGRFLVDYLMTFGTLFLIIILAVWYPSILASRVRPAVVLREE